MCEVQRLTAENDIAGEISASTVPSQQRISKTAAYT